MTFPHPTRTVQPLRPPRRSARLLGARLLVAVALTAALGLVAAPPAAAHNYLVGADPADGSTLARTPAAVVLRFDEPSVALGTQVLVTGPEGAVGQGAPRLVDDTVTQALVPGAPAGRYTVDWRVTSADGHPITGRFSFTATTAAAGTFSPPAPLSAAPAASEAVPAWVWVLVALLTLGATGSVLVSRRHKDATPPAG